MEDTVNVAVSQFFWKTLFDEHKLASQLLSISTKPDGVSFNNVGQFGEVSFKCHPASKPGDNFMSDTFIGTATTQEGTSFRTFIKILPTNTLMRDFAYNSGSHQREMSMYTEFFDLLCDLRSEKGVSNIDLSIDVPHVYYTYLEEKVDNEIDGSGTCILMEDVVASGFRMVDKHGGCDDDHVRLTLRSLSKYHALTISGLKKWKNEDGKVIYPEEAQFLTGKTFYDEAASMYKDFMIQVLTRLEINGRQDLADFINEICNTKLPEILPPDTFENVGPLACILHGDYWCNNMLFKYEDSENSMKPTEAKMVDFQLSRMGHPLFDLLYFLYSSTLPELRKEHMVSWLSFYFNTLVEYLKKLEFELTDYTFEDFMVDYKKKSIALMLLAANIIITVLDKTTVNQMDQMAKFVKENPDSDDECEKNAMGFSSKMTEKVEKYIKSLPPYLGEPSVNHRLIKLIEEVMELNEIEMK